MRREYGGVQTTAAAQTPGKTVEDPGLFAHRRKESLLRFQTVTREARGQRARRHAAIAVRADRCRTAVPPRQNRADVTG